MRSAPILLLLSLATHPLLAQEADSLRLRVGDQVRLQSPIAGDGAWIEARILTVRPHEFEFTRVDAPGRTYARAFDSLAAIDVAYRDPRQSARSGGLWGLFLGAAVGVITGPFIAPHVSMETEGAVAVVGAAGGLAGALVGAAVGATAAPLRWNRYVFQPVLMPGSARPECPAASSCPAAEAPVNPSVGAPEPLGTAANP